MSEGRHEEIAHAGVLVDHAALASPEAEAVMGERQRLSDHQQLEILGLLEAINTEHSAVRAARALAELMRHLHALGQRIAAELLDQDRDSKPVRR